MGTSEMERRDRDMQPIYIVVDGQSDAAHPDLSTIAQALLRGWRLIAGCVILAILVVIGARHLAATPSMSVAILSANPFSVENSSSRGLSSTASTAASLLGVGSTPQVTTDFDRYIQSLLSVRVGQHLMDKYHVDRVLFDEHWDGRQWVLPNDSIIKTFLRWVMVLPAPGKPNAEAVARRLKEIVTIDKLDDSSPFQRVTLTAKSPELAVTILSQLLEGADDVVRRDSLAQTSAYQTYLTRRLQDSNVPALERETLTSRVSELDQKMMLVSTNLPFAMVIDDGPYIERQRVSMPVILLATVVAGAILGCILVFFVNMFPSAFGRIGARYRDAGGVDARVSR